MTGAVVLVVATGPTKAAAPDAGRLVLAACVDRARMAGAAPGRNGNRR